MYAVELINNGYNKSSRTAFQAVSFTSRITLKVINNIVD